MNHNIIFGENLQSGANYKETLLNHNKMISFANQNFFFIRKKKQVLERTGFSCIKAGKRYPRDKSLSNG